MSHIGTSKATRLASSFFAKYSTELLGGAVQRFKISILDLAIISLVFAESTRPLREHAFLAEKYGYEDEGLPNEFRPAVSLKFIYATLGLSRETTRRRLERLVDAGYLIKTDTGYIFPQPAVGRDFSRDFRRRLVGYLEEIVEVANRPRKHG